MTNVLQYLEQDVSLFPEKTALQDEQHSISYAELYQQARAIGSHLAAQGFRNRPVGVVIRRNIESLVMFLGITYSGNFYVPLDSQMPAERLDKMLDKLEPAAILGMEEDLPPFAQRRPLSYEQLILQPIDDALLAQVRRGHLDEDPLYAIFTSGSTGIPKSVLVSHRGVIDLTERFSESFDFDAEDHFGNQAPFDFDVSVKDIYQCLKQGATLVVIPKELFSMPARLITFLNEYRITTIIWAVSALRIVAQLKAFRKALPQYLKNVMFSGEVMPVKVLNYWREALPQTTFVNLYGPTEITCNCTYHIVDRAYAEDEALPIGIPFSNTRIYLLDSDNRPCGPGQIGEICVGGAGVSLGYYADGERTAPVFVQNPLNDRYREILYRTGDLGQWSPDGLLLFAGRKDHQIKHMGHRIELGEIETAVNALDFVDVGCCLYDEQKEKIVLFYQAPAPCDREILLGLKDKLPKYMWPNRLIHQETFALNAHGKIDRTALKRGYLHGTNS